MASAPLSSSAGDQPGNPPESPETSIPSLLKAGRRFFHSQEEGRALAMFKKAYLLSRGIPEPATQARCLFNLGAAYIATGKPRKGLKCLWKAKAAGPGGERDGDLDFNLAAAYEGLREYAKAAEFYGKAVSQYEASRPHDAADALIKLAYCLVSTGDLASATRSFRLAGQAYQKAEQPEDAAMAMREAANYALQSQEGSHADVLESLRACEQLCAEIANQALLGKLYNHVGLHYAEIRHFGQAEKCFVEAMKLCSGEHLSVRKRAVLLQNLGAVYNALEQFERSLRYHSEAADLYGALGETGAQAQSLYNLASAHSQLQHDHLAGFYHQQALAAFARVGDRNGQAQACEGLGGAHLAQGQVGHAIHYYKQALGLFEQSKETSEISQARIWEKLADVAHYDRIGREIPPNTPCRTDLALPVGSG